MWLDNLKELKKSSGMSLEQIAEVSKVPESTVKRIFSGKNEPMASTLFRVVNAMGGSLDDVLADTSAVISPQTIVEVKEVAEVVAAEKNLVLAELEMLKTKTTAQEAEIALLKERLQHKEEIIALHNYYNKLIPNN